MSDVTYDHSWIVKAPDGTYTVDQETLTAMVGDGNPRDIPEFELKMRISIVHHLNDGWLQLTPPGVEPLGGAEKLAWEKLRNCAIVTTNPYSGSDNYRAWTIYRFRLFSERERSILRKALRKPGSSFECVEGGAGLMDELEMIWFETGGKLIKELRRTIGR